MPASWIDESVSYDENQNEALITLFIEMTRGYYSYYYRHHTMLLIEYASKTDDQTNYHHYVADYVPGGLIYSRPYVKLLDFSKNIGCGMDPTTRQHFLKRYSVKKDQYTTWKVPLELALQLMDSINAQKRDRAPIASFSIRGGFWNRETSSHNCLTWAQHELGKIGIHSVSSKSWFFDKFAVVPAWHIGWIDDESNNSSGCVLIANIHP